MRFAFCNEGFGEAAWPVVCRTIAEAGYDGVEIAPFIFAPSVQSIPSHRRAEIQSTAQDAGLEVVGLHWILAETEGLHVGHPDDSVRRRTRDYLCHLADFCADLGGRVMVLGSPNQRGQVAGASDEDTWRWAAETLEGALDTLAERGVVLCIEPLSTEETEFINTAEEGRRLVDELGHPSFGLMLDVHAMALTESRPMEDVIKDQREVLAHLHANDANRQGPGCGEVDFHPILKALRRIGYDGYVSVEPFEFDPDAETVARQCVRYLRDCLPGE
jgi:sugar phosphate isomerase/epimerase